MTYMLPMGPKVVIGLGRAWGGEHPWLSVPLAGHLRVAVLRSELFPIFLFGAWGRLVKREDVFTLVIIVRICEGGHCHRGGQLGTNT